MRHVSVVGIIKSQVRAEFSDCSMGAERCHIGNPSVLVDLTNSHWVLYARPGAGHQVHDSIQGGRCVFPQKAGVLAAGKELHH